MSDRRRSAVALVVGVGLGILGLVGGLIVMGAMLLATFLTWFNFGRIAFGGLSIGLGLTWAIVFARAAQDCALPTQPCGAAPPDLAPHIAISVGFVVLGLAAVLLGRRAPKGDEAR